MTPKDSGSRSGFTLIELLVVVAIVATMVTVGVAGIRSGQGAARIKGAARDIFATIRHARSVALVSQQPSIITYYTDRDGDEPCARVEIVTAKLMEDTGPVKAQTLAGESVTVGGDAEPETKKSVVSEGEGADPVSDGGGQSVADVLFAPISTEVVRGVRLLVKKEGESLSGYRTAEQTKTKISVFSNVDYLLGRYQSQQKQEAAKKAAETESSSSASVAGASEEQPRVSFVWEVNGRCEPHRVYVFKDGTDPEKGLCIRIDRFGAAKIIGEGEEE